MSSFFGFNPSGNPNDRPGFSQAADPFAGLSGGAGGGLEEEDEEINFEEWDDHNDDTFGGAGPKAGAPSKPAAAANVDFFGRPTTKAADAIEEEQLRWGMQQTAIQPEAPKPSAARKPARTGYEIYQSPEYIEHLTADPTLWGQAPAKPADKQEFGDAAAAAAKMMTLEEIEAQMAQQGGAIPPQQQQQQQQQQQLSSQPHQYHAQQAQMPPGYPRQSQEFHRQQQQQQQQQQQMDPRFYQQGVPPPGPGQPQHLEHMRHQQQMAASFHDRQLQQETFNARQGGRPVQGTGHGTAPHIVTHPQQLLNMSTEDRAAALAEDAKRAKRNHKIWLLSKDNGLMTPQDKNFITRIQLQQLMAATGGMEDKDPDASLSEDFYYQVITSIRGGPRQNPNQPLSHFAQTYLLQTGGRGAGNRRHGRADNHMQRMEQQVQRAVEAAKLKPKSKQLVLEGSLGKISFSNAKTPKPLLNIKRHESSDLTKRPASKSGAGHTLTGSDRKSILNNIEVVYGTLMNLEDEARKEPLLPPETEPSEEFKAAHAEWSDAMQAMTNKLWDELKVLEAINPTSNVPHPFIAFLSYAKGKKAIPRIFRYLNQEQRVTMLTMIVIHLDILDVIRRGVLAPGQSQLPADARESIDLFSVTVTHTLFVGYVSEASLFTIIGLLGLILDRVNVTQVATTKVGLGILTMLTSRATLIKESGETNEQDWSQWLEYYNRLFDVLEPVLAAAFPPSLNVDDVYVWQFLAAIGSGATPEQQQRLVISVKDRVMETVQQSKTLPPDIAGQKRANVNLFMRAIGLDVDLLE